MVGELAGIALRGNYGVLPQSPSGGKGISIGRPMSSKQQRFPLMHEELAGKPVVQEATTHRSRRSFTGMSRTTARLRPFRPGIVALPLDTSNSPAKNESSDGSTCRAVGFPFRMEASRSLGRLACQAEIRRILFSLAGMKASVSRQELRCPKRGLQEAAPPGAG